MSQMFFRFRQAAVGSFEVQKRQERNRLQLWNVRQSNVYHVLCRLLAGIRHQCPAPVDVTWLDMSLPMSRKPVHERENTLRRYDRWSGIALHFLLKKGRKPMVV